MATTITIQIDDPTEARLRVIAKTIDQRVEVIAGAAVADAARDYFRGQSRSADPARSPFTG